MPRLSRQDSPLVVWHANVNGLRGRVEEVRAAAASAFAVSIQDTRIRRSETAAEVWRRGWPEYRVYQFLHDDNGCGCALLVRASLQQREVLRVTRNRHRLLGVEVTLPGGRRLTLSSLYAPPSNHGLAFDTELLWRALEPTCAVVVGDLNARSEELGCRSSNVHGGALLNFLESSGAVVLNDPGRPTFAHTAYNTADCLDWALSTVSAAGVFSCSVGEDFQLSVTTPSYCSSIRILIHVI